jgi:hypothetical protein
MIKRHNCSFERITAHAYKTFALHKEPPVGLVTTLALKRFINTFSLERALNSIARLHPLPESSSMSINTDTDALRKEWRQALAELPSTPENIPAFFLAHGRE